MRSHKILFCFPRVSLFALILCLTFVGRVLAAGYETANFVVEASSDDLARKVGDAAEKYRANLSVEWLGRTLPRWSRPCVVTVKCAPDLPAKGETVFSFSNGEVYDWKMNAQGSETQILDSVLPHEITHTLIASYFRSPAPRWIDEGMATSVESESERNRYRSQLMDYLHNDRGIAFNEMVSAKEYPRDLTPFYSQAFSVCEYLLLIGGKRRLVEFARRGSYSRDWNGALREYYGYESLGALQVEWLGWLRRWEVAGCPRELPVARKMEELNTVANHDKSFVGNLSNPKSALASNDVGAGRLTRGQSGASGRRGLLTLRPGGKKTEPRVSSSILGGVFSGKNSSNADRQASSNSNGRFVAPTGTSTGIESVSYETKGNLFQNGAGSAAKGN